MRKLTSTGVAELIGDNPERYQLKGADAVDADPASATAPETGQPDIAQPPAPAAPLPTAGAAA
jgi:hypothetical protein